MNAICYHHHFTALNLFIHFPSTMVDIYFFCIWMRVFPFGYNYFYATYYCICQQCLHMFSFFPLHIVTRLQRLKKCVALTENQLVLCHLKTLRLYTGLFSFTQYHYSKKVARVKSAYWSWSFLNMYYHMLWRSRCTHKWTTVLKSRLIFDIANIIDPHDVVIISLNYKSNCSTFFV